MGGRWKDGQALREAPCPTVCALIETKRVCSSRKVVKLSVSFLNMSLLHSSPAYFPYPHCNLMCQFIYSQGFYFLEEEIKERKEHWKRSCNEACDFFSLQWSFSSVYLILKLDHMPFLMKIFFLYFSELFMEVTKCFVWNLKYLPQTEQWHFHSPFLRKLEAFLRLHKDKLWKMTQTPAASPHLTSSSLSSCVFSILIYAKQNFL